jgi:peroxiredoxin
MKSNRLLILMLVVCSFFPFSRISSAAQLAAGSPAPAFTLPDLDSKQTSLEDILKQNKLVLINFWATWCPACKKEIPQLIELDKRLSSRSFRVVGVDVGEPVARVTSYKNSQGISYPILLDAQSETAKKYGVVGLPVLMLVNHDGKVVAQYHEYSDKVAQDVEKNLS